MYVEETPKQEEGVTFFYLYHDENTEYKMRLALVKSKYIQCVVHKLMKMDETGHIYFKEVQEVRFNWKTFAKFHEMKNEIWAAYTDFTGMTQLFIQKCFIF